MVKTMMIQTFCECGKTEIFVEFDKVTEPCPFCKSRYTLIDTEGESRLTKVSN